MRQSDNDVRMRNGRGIGYDKALSDASVNCPAEHMDAEDSLHILYTSGSNGKPKGAAHITEGYLPFVGMTFKYTFDYHDGDACWW